MTPEILHGSVTPVRLPVTEFAHDPSQYIDRVRETGQPEVLTQNGRDSAILMSLEAYEKLWEAADILDTLAALKRGEEDIKAGRYRPAREFFEELANKNGFSLK